MMGLCQSNQGPRDKATGNLLNMSKAYPLFIFSSCSVGVGAEGEARVVVTQRPGQRLDIHAVLERQCREGVPLRYNYDKPEKPRISRVFGYLARFFILFQTEKSSREVVIS